MVSQFILKLLRRNHRSKATLFEILTLNMHLIIRSFLSTIHNIHTGMIYRGLKVSYRIIISSTPGITFNEH
jgi:hypothetical protein